MPYEDFMRYSKKLRDVNERYSMTNLERNYSKE